MGKAFTEEVLEAQISSSERKRLMLGKLVNLIEEQEIDLDQIGSIQRVRVNEWQAMSKDAEGNPQVTDLRASSIVLSPGWETGPKWPVVQPAAPVIVKVPKAKPQKQTAFLKAAIIPDIQFGYRRLLDGTLDPFHDEAALSVCLQIIERERPDVAIFLGDILDLAPVGRHRFESGFALTMQPAIDRCYSYVAAVAALTSDTRILSGNHDMRIQNYITDNAIHAFGIKPANSTPEDWPVMSVQNLLRLDELGVEYVGSYPAGATYLNDNLACIHGAKIGNRNRTAAQLIMEDEQVSVIYGHTHKKAFAGKTRNSRGAPKFVTAYSPGCLCRIDGGVPSVKGGVDAFGAAITQFEDWQQGMGIVHFTPDASKPPVFDHIEIQNGWAMYQGREFVAAEKEAA